MSFSENNRWVESLLKDRNVALIGFADLSKIDADSRYGFKYGISIAMKLEVLPSTTREPSREYYVEYNRVSKNLREASNFLADAIKNRGFNSFSLAGERSNEDYRTRLPFKTLQHDRVLAGLGNPQLWS